MRRGCLYSVLIAALVLWAFVVTLSTLDYLSAKDYERHEEMVPILLEETVHPPRTIMWNGHETCPC